ncbi:2-keto-4-pentenoate hydratase/2-oxohepta-3-ene-1,7-dioic acid hydratase in catechol pathway [Bradyrhizobium sp. LB12.1]|uniref:fumarylacetoacetate hydrolase family protein n=1 Tax=Bradyrhizobium sp. LB12.1 TaxID=3156327 RepID=UPI003392C166
MRFVGYIKPDRRDPRDRMMGVVVGDKVAPLAEIDSFYDDLPAWKSHASEIKAGSIPLAGLLLAPPVPRDAKIVCAAINYVKHGAEAKLPTPTFPNLFARWASELVVDGAAIPVPVAEPDGLDWEVELAAIMGVTTIDGDKHTAAASVFGYTVANDVSGRAAQLQSTTLSTGQWGLGKNVDKSCPIGSFIETADAISVDNLKLETIVDGKVMQSGTTAEMVFSVPELIAFTSRHVTLRPGDVILTGTPDGVGIGRTPRIYMKPGASLTTRIDGLCSITNSIVDSTHRA